MSGAKRGRPRKTEERFVDNKGYVQVRVGKDYVPEHRLALMALLGRPLLPGEQAWHRNGNKADNDPLNIELRVGTSMGVDASEVVCPNCGLPWIAEQPLSLAMPLEEVVRRIADGEWKVVDQLPAKGITGRFEKTSEGFAVPVVITRPGIRARAPMAGQASLFDVDEVAA